MSSSKNVDFAAGVYLSEVQNHIPHPSTHCIRVYTIQYTYPHREVGEGESSTREKGRGGNSSQTWVENSNMTDIYLQSVN